MKRRAFALFGGMLLLGLLPGSALAMVPISMDQANNPPDTLHNAGAAPGLAQTFTAGKTGMLTGVELYLGSDGGTTTTVSIYATNPSTGKPTGAALASGPATVPNNTTWVHVSLSQPYAVTSGTLYAIVIPPTGNLGWYGTGEAYPGGKSYINSLSWTATDTIDPTLADFGFETFVDSVTIQLSWDKAQIPAGTTTPLTLTVTSRWSNWAYGEGAEFYYTDKALGGLPTWFTPGSITCMAQLGSDPPYPPDDPSMCTVEDYRGDYDIGSNPDGRLATLVITVTGTAAPALADVGSSGTAAGKACFVYTQVEPAIQSCTDGTASVAVGTQVTRATAPPTSTVATAASVGSAGIVWLLPMALIALFGGLIAFGTRRRRAL